MYSERSQRLEAKQMVERQLILERFSFNGGLHESEVSDICSEQE